MEPTRRRVGVLGGTFDPPHYGHLAIAEEARCRLALERVLVVPAGRPPHKPGRPISSAQDRVAMVELAIAGNPSLILCRGDLERPGPSYTAGLLEHLSSELGPECDLYFIVGMDSLRDFLTWREPARILELARIVAVGRPGCVADLPALDRAIPGAMQRVTLLEGPGLEIASTDLQQRVREGLPIRYQTPDGVADYIASHRLYLAAAAPAAPGLTLRYEWNAASVPPPHHYEYVITAGPGPRGELTFYPDYTQHDPPAWRHDLALEPGSLEALLALMTRQGVFDRAWRRTPRPIVRDSQAWMTAEAAGKKVRVPPGLPPRAVEAIAPVYEAIRGLVPQALWDDVMARCHQYQSEHGEQ